MTLVMSGVFANYDTDFELQARSLGASRWATQLHITLPAIFPGVVVGALFAFIISWSQVRADAAHRGRAGTDPAATAVRIRSLGSGYSRVR